MFDHRQLPLVASVLYHLSSVPVGGNQIQGCGPEYLGPYTGAAGYEPYADCGAAGNYEVGSYHSIIAHTPFCEYPAPNSRTGQVG